MAKVLAGLWILIIAFAPGCFGSLDVSVTGVSGQTFSFDTGSGIAGDEAITTIEIHVFDKCRRETENRVSVGMFYPSSSVVGFNMDTTGVGSTPGADNTIAFDFVEGIAQNTDIYRVDAGGVTATLEFCAQVGIYVAGHLANWEEVNIVYNIDLVTNLADDPVSWVTSATNFLDSLGVDTKLEGDLNSYFCDPETQAEVPAGVPTRQGSIISICFNVVEGEFEVEDVLELMVKDLGVSAQAQALVHDNTLEGASYSEKHCTATSPTTQTCIVSFLLKASFFDHNSMTLSGEGSLLLQLGDGASGRRKERVLFRTSTTNSAKPSRGLTSDSVANVEIKAHEFPIDHRKSSAAANTLVTTTTTLAVMFLASFFFE